eukprot:2278941-Amphidinium_carterae.2
MWMSLRLPSKPRPMTSHSSCEAKLWRGMDSWEGLVTSWNSMPFGAVEIDPIQKKVQEYNKTAVQSSKAMPDSRVPKVWGDQVTQFKNTLPVVAALRNKASDEPLLGHEAHQVVDTR